MTSQADEVIEALRAHYDTLATVVGALDEDGYDRVSGASEWTVAQVLSHLGSGAELSLAGLDAAQTGDDRRGEGYMDGVWARWNAKSPADQVRDSLGINGELVRRYESLDGAERENLRISLGFLPTPIDVATAVILRLGEFSLHSWDVYVAFDPDATVPAPALGHLVDRSGFYFAFIAHGDALDGRKGTLAVHTHDPERRFGLELGPDAVRVVDEPADPDGVLDLPAEAWLRLTAGRLKPEHTAATVTVTGELADLDDLRRVFPGY